METLLYIAGGVALLLFGVRYLRKGLDRLLGPRFNVWIQRAGARRGTAFFTGLGVAALAPSSTTMSLLAVHSVQAGHLNARQMLAVMLGANIGITILVQIVALNINTLAPLLILIGVVLFQYTAGPRSRGIGQTILSLGLIFLAMTVIRMGIPDQIDAAGDFAKLVDIAERYPVGLMLLAALIAMVSQSGTAAIAIVIGLIAAGVVGYEVAIPTVIGANVGLAATTLVIGWRQVESRRLALGNFGLKLIVAIVCMALLPQLFALTEYLPGSTSRQTATLHTLFNIVVAIIGLPLVGAISNLLNRIVPEPPATASGVAVFGPKYINLADSDSTALAMGQSIREILRTSEIVRGMFDDIWIALRRNDQMLAEEVARRDDQVDLLDAEIKKFLTRLITQDAEHQDADEQMLQLRYLSELETIGDIVDKNISELVIKKIRHRVEFSPEGWRELDEFHRRVSENLLIAETAFTTRDETLARQLLRHKTTIKRTEQEFRDKHFARLTAGRQQSHETSAIHLDLLTHLRRINSAAANIAYAILEVRPQGETLVARGDSGE
ncbi:MAG TPA: Na/Pi cotransporter family protein [Phycisphaerales bacterium]|nr:Na/Pi cotransporter family protein [Phycisphaerales bacterium]HRQ75218.1 Na/Pi cotransporter family protein [Phycisphaerales bacterium]